MKFLKNKTFSNELAPILLDIYDSWGKLGTMEVICGTEITYIIYKIKVIEKMISDCKLQTHILKVLRIDSKKHKIQE